MKKKDPDEMNEQRVKWAQKALDTFRKNTACEPGEEALQDLLTNLQHWADSHDISWEKVLAAAMDMYREETGSVVFRYEQGTAKFLRVTVFSSM